MLLLQQANLSLPSRPRGTCLVPNRFDCHTTLELQAPSGAWQILDPTFAVSPVDAQTGAVLSVADMSDAVRSGTPERVTYSALDALALDRLGANYIDYVLLFAQPGPLDAAQPAPEISVIHHYERRGEVRSSPGHYALRCAERSAAISADVDGVMRHFDCVGLDRLTPVFSASSIAADATGAPSLEIHAPRRYTTGLSQP